MDVSTAADLLTLLRLHSLICLDRITAGLGKYIFPKPQRRTHCLMGVLLDKTE